MTVVRRHLLFVVLAVAAVYANSLAGSFQFDDWNVIVGEPTVHSLAAWLADLGRGIRPLLKLSYALNWSLNPAPMGFHVVNVAIHIANALLVYELARELAARMLHSAGETGTGRSRGGNESTPTGAAENVALATALLFGLHPVQAEAVTYVSGRSTALMCMFYLAGLLAHVAGAREGRRWLRSVGAPALFVLAVATKEIALTFPFAVLLVDLTRRGATDWRSVARSQLPYALLLLFAAALLAIHPLYGPRLGGSWAELSWRQVLPTQVSGLTYLLARLACIYPPNIDPDLRVVGTWSPLLVVQGLFLLGGVVAGLACWRRLPWLGFGILWVYLHLAPTNSLLPRPDVANERALYLAGFGAYYALAFAWWRICASVARPLRQLGLSVGAGVLVVLAVLTVVRNADYATEIRLWEQTARVSPDKPRVHNNLGYAYQIAGCTAQARRAYARALALDPGYRLARENLAALPDPAAAFDAPSCAR